MNASATQTETLRRALDELGGEFAKEAFGRRREVALRIRMVNREEKLRGELERWVLKAEETQEHARVVDGLNEGDEGLRSMVGAARKLLEETFGGQDGGVGRAVVADAAVRELMMELEKEMGRRLELERIVVLAKAAAVDVAADDEHIGKVLEKPEKQPETTPMQDDTSNPTPSPVVTSGPERLRNTFAAAKSSQVLQSENLTPISDITTASEQPLTSSMTPDILDDKGEEFPRTLPTDSQLPSVLTQKPSRIPVKDDTPETPPLKVVEAVSDQKPLPRPEFTDVHDIQQYPKDPTSASLSISSDIPNGEEKVFCLLPTDLVSSIPNEISTDGIDVASPSVEALNDPEVSSPTVVEPVVVINVLEASNGRVHHQNVVSTDEEVAAEGEPINAQHDEILEVVSLEERRSDNTPLNGPAISNDQPNGVNYDSMLDIEDKSLPPTPASLQDASTPPPEPTSKPLETLSVSNVSPGRLILVDTPPPVHPLLADLAKTKHRYDALQRALRDCHLALESLSTSIQSTVTGHVSTEALSTAIQRLNDYTEDARVELEIRIADEEVVGRGFEMMLCVPGALASSPTLHVHLNSEQEQDQDTMTHSDVERQVEAFVDGTDPSVNKAVWTLSRKLEDIEHDIAVLQRVVHDVNDTDAALLSPHSSSTATTNANEGGGGGWTSWIRNTPTSLPSSSPSLTSHTPLASTSSLGLSPKFGSIISSPRLRHVPSFDFPGAGGKQVDPLATLGLRVPMPSYIQHQLPAAVHQSSRTLSTTYMLGLGARSVSGSGNGSGFFGGLTSPRKGVAAPQMQDGNGGEEDEGEESDVE